MSRAWEFLMALKDKRKFAEGSRQEEFEELRISSVPQQISNRQFYGV